MDSRLKTGYIDAFFVILIWAGFSLVSRMATQSTLLHYDLVALRFGTAALLLIPYCLLKHRINLLNPRLIVLGLMGGLSFAMLAYYGFTLAPAAHGGILLPGMLPFTSAVCSWLILGQIPSLRRSAGLIIIASGALCLGIEAFSKSGDRSWQGDISFLGASFCLAIYSALAHKWHISARDSTIGGALIAAIVYMPIYLLFLPKGIDAAPLATIALQAFYQGVLVVIVAMVLYMRAVNSLGPARIGLCMAMVPVLVSLAAVPLLGEPLTAYIVLGLVLTCAGTWIGSRG